jgi:hypothetical protein
VFICNNDRKWTKCGFLLAINRGSQKKKIGIGGWLKMCVDCWYKIGLGRSIACQNVRKIQILHRYLKKNWGFICENERKWTKSDFLLVKMGNFLKKKSGIGGWVGDGVKSD